MHTHKYKADTDNQYYVRALCGREVRRSTAILSIQGVTCIHCRRAWDRLLAALPDVFPPKERK